MSKLAPATALSAAVLAGACASTGNAPQTAIFSPANSTLDEQVFYGRNQSVVFVGSQQRDITAFCAQHGVALNKHGAAHFLAHANPTTRDLAPACQKAETAQNAFAAHR